MSYECERLLLILAALCKFRLLVIQAIPLEDIAECLFLLYSARQIRHVHLRNHTAQALYANQRPLWVLERPYTREGMGILRAKNMHNVRLKIPEHRPETLFHAGVVMLWMHCVLPENIVRDTLRLILDKRCGIPLHKRTVF
jgi:hypothetical protein